MPHVRPSAPRKKRHLYAAAIAATLLAATAISAAACTSSSSPDTTSPTDPNTPRDASPLDSNTGSFGNGGNGTSGDASGTDGPDATPPRLDAAPPSDAGTDASSPPPDAGPPPAASLWASDVLPAFDMATVSHVRDVRAAGRTKGNHPDVIAKFGDSITASTNFLSDIGNGSYSLGSYSALSETIASIRNATLSDGKNSFNHVSSGAVGGWTSTDALGPPSAIEAEVSAIRPAYAIVMFGTNDRSANELATDLNEIVNQLEGQGTVAILSTVPDRVDYSGADALIRAINDQVRALTSRRHLPLIDLFVALAPLPDLGIGPDGVHPSVQSTGTSGDFTNAGLQYGYNTRNLTAIQMFDRLLELP